MSGRLIILPHKSWNVWNRDNIEKVQRDERLHEEEQQRLREKSRATDQVCYNPDDARTRRILVDVLC
jgi:hypothetical protein